MGEDCWGKERRKIKIFLFWVYKFKLMLEEFFFYWGGLGKVSRIRFDVNIR